MKNMNKAMGSLLLFFLFFGCAMQPEQGLEVSEEVTEIDQVNADIEDIDSMDEAFICSSVVGVLPCFWDNWKSNFILTKRLQFLLEESLQK